MGVFYHEDQQTNERRRKYIAATLKDLFSLCQTFGGRLSKCSSLDEDYPMSDFEEELEVVVSAVISGVMEKQRQKPSVLRHDNRFSSWVYSPETKQVLYFTDQVDHEEEQMEEFYSVKSCFSCGGSSVSGEEAFYSVKTNNNLSGCSSLREEFDLSKLYWRRSVLEDLCRHCQGWPFGLCRRAVLLPPLPKSPSESWLSRKLPKHH